MRSTTSLTPPAIALERVLVGGALSRGPIGIWFSWMVLSGTVLKRFRSEIGSLRAIDKIIGGLLVVLACAIILMRPLQRLLGARWSCFLGTLFSAIGITAASVAVSVWQFFVASGVVLALGSALILVPPLCLGFVYHPKRKGLISGVMNFGILFGFVISIVLAFTVLKPWVEFGEDGVDDDRESDCIGYPWNEAVICRRLSIVMLLMGCGVGAVGTAGSFFLPHSTVTMNLQNSLTNFSLSQIRTRVIRQSPTPIDENSEGGDEVNELPGRPSGNTSGRRSDRSDPRETPAGNIGSDWDAASALSRDELEERATFHTAVSHRSRRIPQLNTVTEVASSSPSISANDIKPHLLFVPSLVVLGFSLALFPSLVLLFSWVPSFDDDKAANRTDDSNFSFSVYSSPLSGKIVLIAIGLLTAPLWGMLSDFVTPLLLQVRAGVEAAVLLFLSVFSTALVMGYNGSRHSDNLALWFILNALSASCLGGSLTLWPVFIAELYPNTLLTSLGSLYAPVVIIVTVGVGTFFLRSDSGSEISLTELQGLIITAIAGVAVCAALLIYGVDTADRRMSK